jgi:hypothetical protein
MNDHLMLARTLKGKRFRQICLGQAYAAILLIPALSRSSSLVERTGFTGDFVPLALSKA